MCESLDYVEGEQHVVFDSTAYSHIRSQHLNLLQHSDCCTIADFMTNVYVLDQGTSTAALCAIWTISSSSSSSLHRSGLSRS